MLEAVLEYLKNWFERDPVTRMRRVYSGRLTASGGAEEGYSWITNDSGVAKVDTDGTVTAVAPGRATVAAKIGEQTFNCAVRCVW